CSIIDLPCDVGHESLRISGASSTGGSWAYPASAERWRSGAGVLSTARPIWQHHLWSVGRLTAQIKDILRDQYHRGAAPRQSRQRRLGAFDICPDTTTSANRGSRSP